MKEESFLLTKERQNFGQIYFLKLIFFERQVTALLINCIVVLLGQLLNHINENQKILRHLFYVKVDENGNYPQVFSSLREKY